jgi:hypothetical protein
MSKIRKTGHGLFQIRQANNIFENRMWRIVFLTQAGPAMAGCRSMSAIPPPAPVDFSVAFSILAVASDPKGCGSRLEALAAASAEASKLIVEAKAERATLAKRAP